MEIKVLVPNSDETALLCLGTAYDKATLVTLLYFVKMKEYFFVRLRGRMNGDSIDDIFRVTDAIDFVVE